MLECRLDNVVYRAGFARTRRHARQLVVHGHFQVNGRKVDIPSFQVSAHDVIDVRSKSVEMTPFIVARETHGERLVPAWLEVITEQDAGARAPAPGACSRSTCPSRSSSSSSTTPRSNGQRYAAGAGARLRPRLAGEPCNLRRHIAGGAGRKNTSAHRPAPVPVRRGRRRAPLAVLDRAPRAGLRLHPRQLAASYAAVVDPGRGRHVDPRRRRPARVLDDRRRPRGRHRGHPEPQAARRLLRARRARHDVPAQAGPGRGHRRRHRASGRCRGAQPRARARQPQRQGQARHGARRRAWPWLRLGRPEQGRRRRDRPDAGRLDLLARSSRSPTRSRRPVSSSAPTSTG